MPASSKPQNAGPPKKGSVPPAPAATSPIGGSGDEQQQLERLRSLRRLANQLSVAAAEAERNSLLQQMQAAARAMASENLAVLGSVGATLLQTMAAFIDKLSENPPWVLAVNARTLEDAAELLLRIAETPAAAKNPSTPLRALAVDDEPDVLMTLDYSLDLAKIAHDSVATPGAAMELAGRVAYDLFVLDVMLPQMDGFELCEKLRGSSQHKETPALFVTGAEGFQPRLKTAQLGRSDFIAKPFLPAELGLRSLIQSLCRRYNYRSGAPGRGGR